MSQPDSKKVSPRHRLLCYYFVIEYELRSVGVKKHRNEAWKEGEPAGRFLTNTASTVCYQKQLISGQERPSSERPHDHSLGQPIQGKEKGRRYPLVSFSHW